MIDEVVASAIYLSNQRWGGLMIIERTTGLQDVANKGVSINGDVSSALLGNIFVPNTPLHDGAVIIRQNRVVAAACILPLSDNLGASEHFGTRHKAAVGISEQSDAVAVVVSEETGKISIANNGRIYTKLTRETLREMLISLLQPGSLRPGRSPSRRRFKIRTPQLPTNPPPSVGKGDEADVTGDEKSTDTRQPSSNTIPDNTLNPTPVILHPMGDETRRALIQGKPSSGTVSQKAEDKVRLEKREP
jgi:hypothetical protein